MDPREIPDLPRYIVALWRIERHMDFKTAEELKEEESRVTLILRENYNIARIERIGDARTVYFQY